LLIMDDTFFSCGPIARLVGRRARPCWRQRPRWRPPGSPIATCDAVCRLVAAAPSLSCRARSGAWSDRRSSRPRRRSSRSPRRPRRRRQQQNLRALELAHRMLAAAKKPRKFATLGLAQFDPIPYIHPHLLLDRGMDEHSDGRREFFGKNLHAQAGQVFGYPPVHAPTPPAPAETDMQQYFRVSPPSVHQMVLTLERAGFIKRQPRVPRSIEVLVDPKLLPELL
jgi:hypothetical protein